jgi:hypothetical protein
MGKDKFKKRKERRRLIRGEMTKRGISGKDIAVRVNRTESAVSQGCATSPRIVAALIEAGVPERMFKHVLQPKSPLTPLCKGGEGEGDKDHRLEACATEGA